MRMRVDYGAEAVLLDLADRPIRDSAEVADGIIFDYDADGQVVGIEILGSSHVRQQRKGGEMPGVNSSVMTGSNTTTARMSSKSSSRAAKHTAISTYQLRFTPACWMPRQRESFSTSTLR